VFSTDHNRFSRSIIRATAWCILLDCVIVQFCLWNWSLSMFWLYALPFVCLHMSRKETPRLLQQRCSVLTIFRVVYKVRRRSKPRTFSTESSIRALFCISDSFQWVFHICNTYFVQISRSHMGCLSFSLFCGCDVMMSLCNDRFELQFLKN